MHFWPGSKHVVRARRRYLCETIRKARPRLTRNSLPGLWFPRRAAHILLAARTRYGEQRAHQAIRRRSAGALAMRNADGHKALVGSDER